MKTLSFEKKYPNFKKDYPSFSEDPFVSEGWMWEEDKEVVIRYCLDKQRVREVLDKIEAQEPPTDALVTLNLIRKELGL